MSKRLLTIAEAAVEVGYSDATIRRAIHTTEVGSFPPPLKAKRENPGAKDKPPSGRYLIRSVDLDAWIDSLPDA